MAVSDEVKKQLDRSLIAYELLTKKELKSKSHLPVEVVVSKKQLGYYKTEGNYSVYFDLTYEVDGTEFLEDVITVLKLIEDVTFEMFSNFQFSRSGHLVKRTDEIFESDDVCCFLNKIDLDTMKNLKVTMGQEFQAYE
jgi:hypothetical protein